MATEVIKTVKSSGGDYTSLSAWEAGQQGNLVTADEIRTAECYSFQDTTAVTIVGWTTDATRYIKITTPSAERHDGKWNAGKYRLEVSDTGSGFPDLWSREDYVRIDGLQIRTPSVDANFQDPLGFTTIGASNDLRVSNCIIRGADNASYKQAGIRINDADAIVKIWNVVIYDIGDDIPQKRGIKVQNATTVDLYNVTINGCYEGIFQAAGTVNVYESAVFNNTDDFSGTFNTIDYCASDDNDGTNNVAESGGGAFWPDDFVDAANGDFHLKSSSNLVGAGNDSGSGLFSNDIDGETRTSPSDIGADEYVSAGGALLDAALSATGSQASDLTTSIAAKSAVSCVATVAAALSTAIVFAATVTASAQQTGAFTTSIPLDAAVSATATQSSELTVLDIDLFDAAVTASATATGELATQIPFSAAAAGSVTTTAALTTQIQFDSALTATATQASGLTTSITVDCAISTSCTVAVELTAPQQILLAASPAGTAAASATLTTGAPILNVVSYTLYFAKKGVADALFTKSFIKASQFTPKKKKEVWF